MAITSQIDQLLELKKLYEQGILTKEEMEAEKQKILGTAIETPKPDSSQNIEQQSHIEAKEPAKISVENTGNSFFNKYKGYVIGIALLLVIACVIFVPRKATAPDMFAVDSIPELKTFALKGMINYKIGFSMDLEYSGNEVEGIEHYDSQKSDVNVSIKGTIDEKGHMILREYDGNIKAGTFEGTMGGETYSGTFTNSKGKTFPFSANVLTESALAKIEEEGKQFETTKIVYKNNTSSANVELSVDYPIKGNDALLQSTRKYINEIIAEIFQIKGYEYRGSLNDGNSVINSYGKTKFDELNREWKEDEYERTSGYEESINLIKDYENEYCVSLCAHSYYFHGGVYNSFCYAATFRKVDGKRISIIKSADDTGLQGLIVSALKNKIGEKYESVNEDFRSSPWPGFAHIVNKGVQIDYQNYEIGPLFLGQISITIPYEKIKPYMTEEAKKVLDY